MRICVLTGRAAERYAAGARVIDCRRHWHVSRDEATELVVCDHARIIGPRVIGLKYLVPIRGFSARFGGALAEMLAREQTRLLGRTILEDVIR
jgi:hypothetical protein